MTEHCIVCGMEIPEGRQVCPACETKVQARDPVAPVADHCGWLVCGRCVAGPMAVVGWVSCNGSKVGKLARFCPNCGCEVKWDE